MVALKNRKAQFVDRPEWKIDGACNDGRQPIDAQDRGKSGQAKVGGGEE